MSDPKWSIYTATRKNITHYVVLFLVAIVAIAVVNVLLWNYTPNNGDRSYNDVLIECEKRCVASKALVEKLANRDWGCWCDTRFLRVKLLWSTLDAVKVEPIESKIEPVKTKTKKVNRDD